ncbi:MAG: hypothetical protein COT73_08755, partial [Bdellovibrio sp. CG10_big_fil_rev_8_21_14_0_10_47_8]
MKIKIFGHWALLFFMALGISTPGRAQMMNIMGGGGASYGGSCPYPQSWGDEAESIQDEISEVNESLRDLKEQLREAKRTQRDLEKDRSRARRKLESRGLKSEYIDFIDGHIDNDRACVEYGCPRVGNGRQQSGLFDFSIFASRAPASSGTDGNADQDADSNERQSGGSNSGNQGSDKVVDERNSSTVDDQTEGKYGSDPFTRAEWCGGGGRGGVCDPGRKGRVLNGACGISNAQVEGGMFRNADCKESLKSYQDLKPKLVRVERDIEGIGAQIDGLKEHLAALKGELRTAKRDYQKDMREQMTEGGCIECQLQGSGYISQRRGTDWGGVVGNVALGLGSIFLGNSLQKSIANQNAQLGAVTPGAMPSYGFGFPFMMGAIGAASGGGGGLYGAIGGGIGAGGYGCANGMYGNGYGNMVGGAFGYPAGYFGGPYGGGMYAGMPMGMMMGGMPMGMMVNGGLMMGGMSGMMMPGMM